MLALATSSVLTSIVVHLATDGDTSAGGIVVSAALLFSMTLFFWALFAGIRRWTGWAADSEPERESRDE